MNDDSFVTTPWGVKWKVASGSDVIITVVVILVLILVFFGLVRYIMRLKDQKILDRQLFLFKLRRRGLSNFQIKLINDIVDMLRLANPNNLLTDLKHFESIVGRFLLFLRDKDEHEDPIDSICKELIVIYEKLFLSTEFRKALNSMDEIEDGHLIYFNDKEDDIYLGKILNKDKKDMDIMLFRNSKMLQKFNEENLIKVHIWRSGDAEYSFEAKTIGITGNTLKIETPGNFEREKEFRHPYIDVIIPSIISEESIDPESEPAEYSGTINKINDYEMIMRVEKELDYRKKYSIKFQLNKFNISISSKIISKRVIREDRVVYYTFKFVEMSEAANSVLRKYIYEHL